MIAPRGLFMEGHTQPGTKVVQLARFCAWGNHWMSAEDFVRHVLGAPTSHGLCDACFKVQMAAVESMPTPPAA